MSSPRGRKSPLERELEVLASASTARDDVAQDSLRRALGSTHPMVISKASRLIAERAFDRLRPELEAAFRRFLSQPDPSAQAKIALIEALDRIESPTPELFLEAATCSQIEYGFGDPVDVAVQVRARAILALARIGYHDLLLAAAGLLSDKEAGVRQAAAEAIEAAGERKGAAVLLLKLRAGDDDPMVTLACLEGVLTLAHDLGLKLSRELLWSDESGRHDIAAVALGQNTQADALELLVEWFKAMPAPTDRELALRGIGYHRSERARTFLLETVTKGNAREAKAAIVALASRAFESGLQARTAEAARANTRVALAAVVAQAFAEQQR